MQNETDIKCIHIYCGDGKGKTTAAIGLTVRAAGAGKKVLFSQFMKGSRTSELEILKAIPNVRIMRSDKEFPFYEYMTDTQKREQMELHNEMIRKMIELLTDYTDDYMWRPDVIVMDEVTYPYNWELLDRDLFNQFMKRAKNRAELILTGRNPAKELLESADYVTEMCKRKHPYDKGVPARFGIEM